MTLISRPATLADKEWIEGLYRGAVLRMYDEAEDYPNLWWESHLYGVHHIGLFTTQKDVCVLLDDSGEPVGAFVASHKRGGSTKISPLLLKGAWSTKLVDAWKAAEAHARGKGARKVYCDVPSVRRDLVRHLAATGVSIEAHLKRHYNPKYDTIVLGKILCPTSRSVAAMAPRYCDDPGVTEVVWRPLERNDEVSIRRLVVQRMSHYYAELENFVDALFIGQRNLAPSEGKAFQRKGKQTFVGCLRGEVVSFCVATPKRGGALKIGPLCMGSLMPQSLAGSAFSSVCVAARALFAPRKLYTLLPIADSVACSAARSSGLEPEGLLREPYSPGVDVVVYGKCLTDGVVE